VKLFWTPQRYAEAFGSDELAIEAGRGTSIPQSFEKRN